MPFATQSRRPKAPFMRGSSNPRKRSSSPSTVLNSKRTTMRAYHPQAPLRNACPASEPTKSPKSRFARSEEHSLNSSHVEISYAVFCLKKKKKIGTVKVSEKENRVSPDQLAQ